jgi:hypothetical protein
MLKKMRSTTGDDYYITVLSSYNTKYDSAIKTKIHKKESNDCFSFFHKLFML